MRSSIIRASRRLLRDRSGSLHIIGAFTILVAMGVGAVSVDLIAVQNTSERMQTAAALTCERIERADNAIYRTSGDLAAAAQQFMRDQFKNDPLGADMKATVVVTRPEKSGAPISDSELKVAVSGDVDTIMAKALGLARGTLETVRLCKPQPLRSDEGTCTEAQRAFLVMESIVGDDVRMRMLRTSSRLDRDAFVMTLTDHANTPIYRQAVVANMTIGKTLGGRELLPTDRLHFQPVNADGTLPPFCPGLPAGEEPCQGAACEKTPPECKGRSCGTSNDNGGGPACNDRDFIGSPTRKREFDDAHFDPSARRGWETNATGQRIAYYYSGNELYKIPRNIEMRIALSRNYLKNDTSVTVNYRRIGSGNKDDVSTTMDFAYLSKIKGANARTFETVLRNNLRLVYVRDHDKALWEKPDGTCLTIDSPIVLALDGRNKIHTTGTSTSYQSIRLPGRTVSFDIRGTGRPVWTEWIVGDGGQAFLVDNRDGRAAEDMNGTRLFGANGTFENGYEKLRALDTSGTGILRGADLEGLAAWIDNGNATVDPGELVSLASLGITELGTEIVTAKDAEGLDLMRSWAVRNGKPIMTEDVWFVITDREVAEAPQNQDITRH